MSDSLTQLTEDAATKFKKHFGREPRWLVAAPGRVNLIGEHVDYNDGFVLPMAIEQCVVIAADSNGSDRAGIRSAMLYQSTDIPLGDSYSKASATWANYIVGVLAGFAKRGAKVGGFDALIESDVPLGGGLSSSAALEVATATLLETMTGHKLELTDKALLCQQAEHEFAGMPCGIMDQSASVMGKRDHLLLLDCRSREVEYVPMKDESVTVLIVDTRVKHELTRGAYAERRKECEAACHALGVNSLRDVPFTDLQNARTDLDPIEFRRARHVVTEIERTLQAAEAIRAGDWPTVGDLMQQSHESLRDDYEVSCYELDLVVSIAGDINDEVGDADGPIIGCRMTGAGFGGCVVCLVRSDAVESVAERIAREYQADTEIEPAVFVTRPADGARVLQSK